MKISAHLNAIEADLITIQADLDIKDIKVSPGRFDASEITRRSFKAPALRIAFLGAPRTVAQADETRKYDCAFAVFILTDGKTRALEGVDIAEAVAAHIELNRFSAITETGVPKNIRMDALYSTHIDDKGISLYSVSWTQSIKIGKSCALGAATDENAVIPPGTPLVQDIDITQLPDGV